MLRNRNYWCDYDRGENECVRSCYQRRCDGYSTNPDYCFLKRRGGCTGRSGCNGCGSGCSDCSGFDSCCVRRIAFAPSRDTFLCPSNINHVSVRDGYTY